MFCIFQSSGLGVPPLRLLLGLQGLFSLASQVWKSEKASPYPLFCPFRITSLWPSGIGILGVGKLDEASHPIVLISYFNQNVFP